jgi:prepilin-type N-terminal cleavage/methylation domain-containing protein
MKEHGPMIHVRRSNDQCARGKGRSLPPSPVSLPPSPFRRGFTLVEILVVIAIIAVLVGLLTAAAIRVRETGRVLRVANEISQLGLALEEFKNKIGNGEYPPDFANSSQSKYDVQRFMARAFSRCPANRLPGYLTSYYSNPNASAPAYPLNPSTALYFWLAGPFGNGFSADPMDPFDQASVNPSRIGPFYEFDRLRLFDPTRGAQPIFPSPVTTTSPPVYVQFNPANDVGTTAPYVYYKAVARSYLLPSVTAAAPNQWKTGDYKTPSWAWTDPDNPSAAASVMPFQDSGAWSLGDGLNAWVSPATFQILSPGLDGKYDNSKDNTPPRFPLGDNYNPKMRDDITSFSNGKLESKMPN